MLHAQRLFIASLLMMVSLAATAAGLPIPSPPSLGAKTYVLVDFNSGQVLAAKNPDQRIEPASVTKLMTAYIIFDEIKRGDLSPKAKVTVSEKSWKMKGSQMFLEVGDKVTVDNLLHGLITASGNDAAVSLAEYVAGTTSAFVNYMNQYADQLGMDNSHFMDVNGLPHADHYMSARDIATLYAAIVRRFPKLYDEYFHNKKFAYNGIQQYNRNSLLWLDERVDGGKTGHTESAGYNLVASGKAEGMRVISVVTGTNSENARKSQCEALISYGFRFYQDAKLFDNNAQISKVRVWKGAASEVPVVAKGAVNVAYPRGKRDDLKINAELPSQLTAPVHAGERLGTLAISYNDKALQKVPLYAGKTVAEGGYIRQAMDSFWMLFQ